MTPNARSKASKPADSHAAPTLHAPARMPSSQLAVALGFALAVGLAAPNARAQSMTTMSAGTCSGGLMGTVGLSLGGSSPQSVAATSVPFLFGQAECACASDPDDIINLEIKLTQAFPQNTTGTLELWVGNGCDNYTTRTTSNQMQCEKLATSATFQEFVQGSTSSTGFIEIPINAQALTSPIAHICDPTKLPQATNSVYLLLTTTDPMNPSKCTLTGLTEFNQGPTAATGVNASSGSAAVTVSWLPPPVSGSVQPKYFQVLCATADGQPVPGITPPAQAYSTCVNGKLSRRAIPTASSLGSTGSDGGTPVAADLGTASAPLNEGLHTDALDGGLATGDGGVMITNSDFVKTLDPRFICSASQQVSGTNYSQRISGLINKQPYQFVVLSIDLYGNATPSAIVVGTPQPTEDLWNRFYDEGGRAGFCQIGGGIAIAGDALLVLAALGLLLAFRRRWRA